MGFRTEIKQVQRYEKDISNGGEGVSVFPEEIP